jgi:hypothetical protein
MKLYCLVKNNFVVNGPTIVGPAPTSLPAALVDKSDFELLDLGWYYAECIRPDSFVDRYELMLPTEFDIRATKVICTFRKRNKTQEELDTQNIEKQQLVETDKLNRLTFANQFMQSEEYAILTDAIKLQWVEYLQLVTNTITTNLGDAIWDVNFPMPPQTTNIPVTPPMVGGENV